MLTAPQFAKSTKNIQSTARQQEEQLSDLFVLIRHGERQDHVDRTWKGNTLLPFYDPPLSNAGRKQSFETALKYFALRQERKVERRIRGMFTLFLVSPFHRCVETAAVINVIAFEGRLPMYVEPLLADWQQPKVFRTVPVLGGSYMTSGARSVPGAEGDRLLFRPQVEALRTTLIPFLKTRAAEETELLAEYNIGAEAASGWATLAEEWLRTHTALPVWTCAATASTIEAKVASQPDTAGEVRATSRRSAKSCHPSPPDTLNKGYRGCGVAHPEGKSDLVRRCEQLMGTHFLRRAGAESDAMVPLAIQTAVAAERRTRLPKYFQIWAERTVESRESAGPPALLPPMHVMAITHADVVSTLLEVCCPKYHDKGAGYSVPYCSVTTLQRHNNYYRIPTEEERQRREASAKTIAPAQKHGKYYAKKKFNMLPSNNQLMTPSLARPPSPLPVEWNVEAVGSTDLLRTRIMIQYTK
ncbi:histidine phosphatase, putative [Leishmania panamensis]|uniref:Histidine phosphatase, putative n=2 Tax=Leishmania guyanensis species complex TaxID=38579 RepID=A0A088RKB5_LEIPA|nr:histidine phosphatase, putative [Leishmania panamensis]AIN96467.1 histidine phosphatase, putative [Leishmania panamensis]